MGQRLPKIQCRIELIGGHKQELEVILVYRVGNHSIVTQRSNNTYERSFHVKHNLAVDPIKFLSPMIADEPIFVD